MRELYFNTLMLAIGLIIFLYLERAYRIVIGYGRIITGQHDREPANCFSE